MLKTHTVLQRLRSAYRRALERWERWPPLHYAALFLLQLKVLWGAWRHLDLTAGDTSSYYVYATHWATDLRVNIVWSPLYTAFYGTLLALFDNVYAATVWHRILIVFAASGLLLAVLRRLLPSGLAWLLAAWWVLLPVNFATAYEVHLFALIPTLAAWLTSLRADSPGARGAALAILFVASILVRNEFVLAALAFAGFCLVWEIRNPSHGLTGRQRLARLAAYTIPLLLATLICLAFYARSVVQFPSLWFYLREKHTLNMCQVYAFGYKQRHSDWQGDHWTQCGELMKARFGKQLPSLLEMLRANPRAVLEHFRWNLSLTPNGVQLSLFNAAAGRVTPDYGEVNAGSRRALVLSVAMALILLAGLALLYRERRYWWTHWIRDRALGWCAMLSMLPVWIVVILTQRPRPSYLFSLSAFLMALVGMSVFVIAWRWPWIRRFSPATLLLVGGLLIAVPPYYQQPGDAGPRRILELHQRLSPFQDLIASRETVLLVSHIGFEIRHYLGLGLPRVIEYQSLEPALSATSLQALLDEQGVNLFYLDEALIDRLRAFGPRPFLESTAWADWKLVGLGDHANDRWRLWARRAWLDNSRDVTVLKRLNERLDIAPRDAVRSLENATIPPVDGLFCGYGWYSVERAGTGVFRWASNDVEVVVTSPSGSRRRIVLEVEPGPGMGSHVMELRILDTARNEVARTTVRGHEAVAFNLPIQAKQTKVFRLHVDGGGEPVVNDPRILNFRVFRIDWEAPHDVPEPSERRPRLP